MSSYNLMKYADRMRMRENREREYLAILKGEWPRDINDQMRWMDGTVECAEKMCQADMAYLDDLEIRISNGELGLGWEVGP